MREKKTFGKRQENKEIYKKMADLDTALEDCTESLTDARIKIKELEKENAELKEQNNKAKEFLNEFMRISKASDEDFEHDYSELIGKAEQFLNEE